MFWCLIKLKCLNDYKYKLRNVFIKKRYKIYTIEAFESNLNRTLGELLETPEVDNQQPSLSSDAFEGSETNSRVLTNKVIDSNTDTSALLNNILDIIDDYIVRAAKITKEIAELEDKELLG